MNLPFNPIEILREAIRHVGAVRYAFGLAGLGAAGSIILTLFGEPKAAVLAVFFVFIGVIALLVFARLVSSENKAIVNAGLVLVWAVSIFFITFLAFTISAVALGKPCNWAIFLGLNCQVTSVGKIKRDIFADIHRTVDFSNLKCAENGIRKDIVYWTDKITLTAPLKFITRHLLAVPNTKIEVADLVERDTFEPLADVVTERDEKFEVRYRVDQKELFAHYILKITDGFPAKKEEIGFTSTHGYLVRDLDLVILPPSGMPMTDVRIFPANITAGKCIKLGNGMSCKNLDTSQELTYSWTWDMWKNC